MRSGRLKPGICYVSSAFILHTTGNTLCSTTQPTCCSPGKPGPPSPLLFDLPVVFPPTFPRCTWAALHEIPPVEVGMASGFYGVRMGAFGTNARSTGCVWRARRRKVNQCSPVVPPNSSLRFDVLLLLPPALMEQSCTERGVPGDKWWRNVLGT